MMVLRIVLPELLEQGGQKPFYLIEGWKRSLPDTPHNALQVTGFNDGMLSPQEIIPVVRCLLHDMQVEETVLLVGSSKGTLLHLANIWHTCSCSHSRTKPRFITFVPNVTLMPDCTAVVWNMQELLLRPGNTFFMTCFLISAGPHTFQSGSTKALQAFRTSRSSFKSWACNGWYLGDRVPSPLPMAQALQDQVRPFKPLLGQET